MQCDCATHDSEEQLVSISKASVFAASPGAKVAHGLVLSIPTCDSSPNELIYVLLAISSKIGH